IDPVTKEFGYYSFYPVLHQNKRFLASQLKGQHLIGKHKTDWMLFSNIGSQFIPGNRAMNYLILDSTNAYLYDITLTDDYEQFGALFTARQTDRMLGAKFDQTFSLSSTGTLQNLKTGFLVYHTHRNFYSREFGFYADPDSFVLNLAELNENQPQNILTPEQFRPGGFIFKERSRNSNRFNGNQLNLAAYVSIDFQLGSVLGTLGGRIDFANQQINEISVITERDSAVVQSPTIAFLPSLNLKYPITENQFLKLGYFSSIARPDFREMIPLSYYNTYGVVTWVGNPELKQTYSHNFDFRYEWYPNTKSVFSIGMFGKFLQNPIENYIQEGSIEVIQQFQYRNIQQAVIGGVEAEIRTSLGNILPGTVFDKFYIFANGSYMRSRANADFGKLLWKEGIQPNGSYLRRLQGQVDFMVNCGIYFNDPKTGIETGIFLNQTGKKIVIVGTGPYAYPDFWDFPRTIIDYQFAWKINKTLQFKFILQNILNQPLQRSQFLDGRTYYQAGRDIINYRADNPFQCNVTLNINF
ncbi:MAG: TonB-dependent receptor, partial [Bacteroidia bacterium]|nr:TonB-dependent receptor [Bacteroidia bacterium]